MRYNVIILVCNRNVKKYVLSGTILVSLIFEREMNMNIKHYPLNEVGTNCYFIYNESKALIIDPSGEPEIIFEEIDNLDVEVVGILLTHAHWDHIIALEDVKNKYDVDVYIGEEESDWLQNPEKNLSFRAPHHIGELSFNIIPKVLKEGTHNIQDISFKVIKTPGHSPGSLSYLFNDYIVSGDVLFERGIGRTDLPGSNHNHLMNSIQAKLFTLPENLIVYPGHGDSTTIGDERRENPFF